MTPLSILVASICIVAADYLIERTFSERKSPHPWGFLNDPSNNWLRNPLRESRSTH